MRHRGRGVQAETIFFGGGTPTHLEADLLERLLDGVRELEGIRVREWTSEANPESCDERLQLLVDKGVTRISIGIQSWNPERLRFMDRPHGPEQAEAAYHRARATGAEVSLDMIFGIPGQSLEEWQDELERSLDLEPDHLSCYQLTFEPGTPLEAARRRGAITPNPDETLRDMLLWTRSRLADAGYPSYEISNFAKPGRSCRHNLAYWRGDNYVGVGPGAASHRDGRRATNLRPLEAYVQAIAESGCASFDAEVLSPVARAREAVWLGLRTRDGFDPARILVRTGIDVRGEFETAFDRAVAAGDLAWRDGCGHVPEDRVAYTDEIANRFL